MGTKWEDEVQEGGTGDNSIGRIEMRRGTMGNMPIAFFSKEI
jgi:hypothetical protein